MRQTERERESERERETDRPRERDTFRGRVGGIVWREQKAKVGKRKHSSEKPGTKPAG